MSIFTGNMTDIHETEELGAIKANRAMELKKEARELNQSAWLEDITVRESPITKQTKKGDLIYYRWLCSWQEGGRTETKYLGSCKKMSRQKPCKRPES